MDKFIKVYDNIIPPLLANNIEHLFIHSGDIKYTYLTNITDSNNTYYPGFLYPLIQGNTKTYEPTCFYLLQVLYKLCFKLDINLKKIIQARGFLQVPSTHIGKNGIHTDLDFPHWVLLYYVNDSDGDTILFNDKEEEIQRISPKKGRIVFFDGTIKHCSSSPTKTHRAIINFDFIGEKL